MKERAQFVLFIHMQCTACLPDLHFPPILFARMQCSYSSPASSADKNQNKACQAVDQESKISSSRSQQAVRTRSHCTQPATTLGCEGGRKLAHVPCSCRADRVGPCCSWSSSIRIHPSCSCVHAQGRTAQPLGFIPRFRSKAMRRVRARHSS
jgi:hypothetical protein